MDILSVLFFFPSHLIALLGATAKVGARAEAPFGMYRV
jgi:hypothetical protein